MNKEIRINVVGDFCIGKIGNLSFGAGLKALLFCGDINIVNLEAPIKDKNCIAIKKSGPHLCQDTNAVKFLEDNGFNVISLANNHIMDYGVLSFLKTKAMLRRAKCIGAGNYEEAYKVEKITIQNRVIGLLAVTQYEFGIVDEECTNSLGTAWLCHPSIDELIIESKKECDYLIILPHAGLENFEYPLPEIRSLYRHFIKMGADAIMGGHPHIPQCWEFYDGKPIVYSLGNFCFDSLLSKEPMWNKGLMASLVINEEGVGLEINKLEYIREKKIVDLTDDEIFENFLKRTNEIFFKGKEYLDIVNNKCLALENTYNQYFEMSGYYKPSLKKYIRLTLGLLKRRLFYKKEVVFSSCHMINCLRCETHRWVISRIYNQKIRNGI